MMQLDWDTILEEHYARIARAALMLSGDPWEADDLAQETFVEAMRAESRFAGRSELGTWLYSILLNRHRKHRRSLQRHWRRCLRWFRSSEEHRASQAPDSQLQRREWQASLWSAVARLSEAQRAVVVLRYSEGLPYEQIAEILQCPVSTVRSRLHEAMKNLKKRLGEKAEDVSSVVQEPRDGLDLPHNQQSERPALTGE